MNYQTFREPELIELQEQYKSERWKSLASSLGMRGQLDTIKGDGNPIPYMRLNSKWVKILRTICQSVSDYKSYSHSTIPLEVMEEISFSVSMNYFDSIYVIYDEVEKDPFIIGCVEDKSKYSRNIYLIAQFGEELLPFELLETKAKSKLLQHVNRNLSMYIQNPESVVDMYLDKDIESPLVDRSTAHGRIYF